MTEREREWRDIFSRSRVGGGGRRGYGVIGLSRGGAASLCVIRLMLRVSLVEGGLRRISSFVDVTSPPFVFTRKHRFPNVLPSPFSFRLIIGGIDWEISFGNPFTFPTSGSSRFCRCTPACRRRSRGRSSSGHPRAAGRCGDDGDGSSDVMSFLVASIRRKRRDGVRYVEEKAIAAAVQDFCLRPLRFWQSGRRSIPSQRGQRGDSTPKRDTYYVAQRAGSLARSLAY